MFVELETKYGAKLIINSKAIDSAQAVMVDSTPDGTYGRIEMCIITLRCGKDHIVNKTYEQMKTLMYRDNNTSMRI